MKTDLLNLAHVIATNFRIATLVLLPALLFLPHACRGQSRLQRAETGKNVVFKHGELQRDYRIHVPKNLQEGGKYPLVVSLHGGGGNSRIASAMGLSTIADREKFIVVYPNAINKHWNDGRNSPMFAEQDSKVADVEFVIQLIKNLEQNHPIDPERIFVTGFSTGGFMSQRLIIEHSDIFAGAGIVIASLGKPLSRRFQPKSPVSVVFVNGTEDPLVPYEGGPVGKSLGWRLNQVKGEKEAPRGRCIATDKAVELWVRHNQVESKPVLEKLADKDETDGSTIEYYHWKNGKQGTSVALYKVIGGGHGIPGGSQYLPKRVVGRINQDINGLEIIWDFFKNHARNVKVDGA